MVTTLYLVRHAEAAGNAQEFFQGTINTALTERGLRQLEYLAARFRGIPLEMIWTSPYQRAKMTADAVNRHHALPLQTEEQLREINGGEWESLKWTELPVRYPQEYRMWTEHMAQFKAPNGDAMTDVYARMQAVMTGIARAAAGKTIAVVSHGCALRNFLSFVEFGTIAGLPDVGWADNTAVSLVEYDCDTGKWKLNYKNDSSHLPPECSTLRHSAWNRYEKDKT